MSAFIVSDKTMTQCLQGIASTTKLFNNTPTTTPEGLQKIGTALFAMNSRAVEERYSHDDPVPLYRYKTIVPVSKVQALKSLQCLSYQCAEGDVPNSPLYRELDQVISDLACKIVSDLPAYALAKWDAA